MFQVYKYFTIICIGASSRSYSVNGYTQCRLSRNVDISFFSKGTICIRIVHYKGISNPWYYPWCRSRISISRGLYYSTIRKGGRNYCSTAIPSMTSYVLLRSCNTIRDLHTFVIYTYVLTFSNYSTRVIVYGNSYFTSISCTTYNACSTYI